MLENLHLRPVDAPSRPRASMPITPVPGPSHETPALNPSSFPACSSGDLSENTINYVKLIVSEAFKEMEARKVEVSGARRPNRQGQAGKRSAFKMQQAQISEEDDKLWKVSTGHVGLNLYLKHRLGNSSTILAPVP